MAPRSVWAAQKLQLLHNPLLFNLKTFICCVSKGEKIIECLGGGKGCGSVVGFNCREAFVVNTKTSELHLKGTFSLSNLPIGTGRPLPHGNKKLQPPGGTLWGNNARGWRDVLTVSAFLPSLVRGEALCDPSIPIPFPAALSKVVGACISPGGLRISSYLLCLENGGRRELPGL